MRQRTVHGLAGSGTLYEHEALELSAVSGQKQPDAIVPNQDAVPTAIIPNNAAALSWQKESGERHPSKKERAAWIGDLLLICL